MSGYTPLFSSLTTGTLCGKWPDIGLWPIVLSMADKHGVVDVTPAYISGVTGLAIDDVVACMRRFCEPDPYSRSTAESGARLSLVDEHRDWGWRIVNHGMYREKARLAAKSAREVTTGRNAERMEHRGPPLTAADRQKPPLTDPSNANANADSEKEKTKKALRARVAGEKSPEPEPPPGLDASAWAKWFDYRNQIRKPIKPVSMPAAQRELAGFGSNQSAVVEHSIANSYQGLFAPKSLPDAKKVTLNADGSVMMFAGKPVEWQ